jgi:hypothetical protein
MFTIIRNNALARVGIDGITEIDLVLCANGRFYQVQTVSSLRYFFSQAREARLRATEGESNGWWAFLLILGLAFWVLRDFHDPAPKSRVRLRVRNGEPLNASLRARVREREGSVCAYCRCYAPDGHVDHRVSRVNGGSNHMNN